MPDTPSRSRLDRLAGWALVATGLVLALTGSLWGEATVTWLETLPGGKWLTVPVPYVPILLMALGVWRSRRLE